MTKAQLLVNALIDGLILFIYGMLIVDSIRGGHRK